MKIITGSINYTLEIDPSGQKHSLSYDNKMENDIAALMISAQTLTVQLGQWKKMKAEMSGPDKNKVGANISLIADALRGIKPLMNALLDTYEDYIAYQHEIAAKQADFNVEQGITPKGE